MNCSATPGKVGSMPSCGSSMNISFLVPLRLPTNRLRHRCRRHCPRLLSGAPPPGLQIRSGARLNPHLSLRRGTEPVAESLAKARVHRGRRSVAALPDNQREVLILSHYEQLSLAEIAEITALDLSAVNSRLQRARATLREKLADYAPGMEGLNQRRRTESTARQMDDGAPVAKPAGSGAFPISGE